MLKKCLQTEVNLQDVDTLGVTLILETWMYPVKLEHILKSTTMVDIFLACTMGLQGKHVNTH